MVYLAVAVSILVLLETALIRERSQGISSVIRFQSLFYWKLLSYHGLQPDGRLFPNVSILVLLETALIQNKALEFRPRRLMKFQSLFYWKLLSYFPAASRQGCGLEVSILVLLETALIPHYLLDFLCAGMQFQSLFYWKLLSYLRCEHIISLNHNRYKFQSLFYWKLLSYPYIFSKMRFILFVSILVLLETALILGEARRGLAGQGKVSILVLLETALIRSLLMRLILFSGVSILVLLETALILFKSRGKNPENTVSILVLLETALIPYTLTSFTVSLTCFNPCFIGNCSHTLRQQRKPNPRYL